MPTAQSFPLVTVLLPVYNAQAYVAEAIASILAQTYPYFELLIINDGSVDNSNHIIQKFTDKRLVYHQNSQNIGLIATLNKGLQLAKGKYIARMDADDIATPERLQKQVQFLETHPNYVLVGTQKQYVGYAKPQKASLTDAQIRVQLLLGSAFVHPSVMLRKQTLDTYQLRYRSQHLHAEDYGLWVALSQYGQMANLPFVGIQYRLHSNQISQQFQQTMFDNSYLIALDYLQQLQIPLTDLQKSFLYQLMARNARASSPQALRDWAAFCIHFYQLFLQHQQLLPSLRQLLYRKWAMICLNCGLKKRKIYPIFLTQTPTWWQLTAKHHLAFIKGCLFNQ